MSAASAVALNAEASKSTSASPNRVLKGRLLLCFMSDTSSFCAASRHGLHGCVKVYRFVQDRPVEAAGQCFAAAFGSAGMGQHIEWSYLRHHLPDKTRRHIFG